MCPRRYELTNNPCEWIWCAAGALALKSEAASQKIEKGQAFLVFLAFLEAPLGGPETINSRSKENIRPEVAVRISPGLIHRGVS